MRKFLLIPHLKIHNANAMSSPYTIGFPAITAWLGAVHALQRHIQQNGFKTVIFSGTAISCHEIDLQTYKGRGDYAHSIIGTANPLDKDGNRPAFIEEARCHLDVSLLIEYTGLNADHSDQFKELVTHQVRRMKFAGGDVLSAEKFDLVPVDEDKDSDLRSALRKLMLGHVIIERRNLMQKTMQGEGKDALDALLDHLKIMNRSEKDDKENVIWKASRKEPGWLVPIAVGFQGISDLGFAKNQRDPNTQHRFAESVVTLGEFVMPYRIKRLDEMLWQYHPDLENNLYTCRTSLTLNKQTYDQKK